MAAANVAAGATSTTAGTAPNGAAVAAILSAAIGLLVLGLVVAGSELSKGFEQAVFSVGKSWIPGAAGIGPYSGKETLMLVGWIGSWAALHYALRGKTLDIRMWFGAALALLVVATFLVWPPVWAVLGA